MKEVNPFQNAFFTALAEIQESCVQSALCQISDGPLEERLYNVTAEVIIGVMELLDGYVTSETGRLHITSETTGHKLKESPYLELHDAVCTYLKGADV